MIPLPEKLYTAAAVKALDQIAIQKHKMLDLMERAGHAAFQALYQAWPGYTSVVVFAGAGNNAGDGFVVARLASEAGFSVTLITLADPKKLKGDALSAFKKLDTAQVTLSNQIDLSIGPNTIIVDALLGTGLSKQVSGDWAKAITTINAAGAPILAIDIPSGLCADTGQVRGVAVQASLCISFIGLKVGLLTGQGPKYSGDLVFNDLGVPSSIYSEVSPCALRLNPKNLTQLKVRERTAHKVDNGHLLLIGGYQGMSGAIQLAGEAALRCGAGLVSIATHPEHASWLNTNRPELMCHAVEKAKDLEKLMARATCIAIGPGLGQGKWSAKLLHAVLDSDKPMVMDADALNLLAKDSKLAGVMQAHPGRVITPHPGEAARLLGLTTEELQQDRLAAVKEMSHRYTAVCVLKGAGSLVASSTDETIYLCDKGNPGMATAGTGDVLTGIIGALLCQKLAPLEAAKLAVFLHASAGDIAAQQGERGLLAGDLLPILRDLVNK